MAVHKDANIAIVFFTNDFNKCEKLILLPELI